MRILLVLIIAVLSYAQIVVYKPKGFEYSLPASYEIISYNSLSKVDFKDAFVILPSNKLPFIIDNNLTIITSLGKEKNFILSHVPLNKITSVCNANLPSKIFFSVFKDEIKFKTCSFNAFLRGKSDAIIVHKRIYRKGFYHYDLEKFGIEFNKYYLVASQEVLKKYPQDAEFLNEFLQEKGHVDKFISVNSIILTALYLQKNINFNKLLRFNYFKNRYSKKGFYTVYVTPNWPPFDMEINGNLKGIGIDFWRLIAKKAKIRFIFVKDPLWIDILNKFKEGKADITPNTSATPDRRKYAVFSKPYISFPLAIVCKSNDNIKSINDIKNIAVGFNFTAYKMMKKHYPYLDYIPAKNTFDALSLVENGKAQCAVDILPTMVWMINTKHLTNVRIFFTTKCKFHLQVMIRKGLSSLRAKINNAIDSITPAEKRKIINKYLGMDYYRHQKSGSHFEIFAGIILILILFLAFVIYQGLNYRKKSQTDALTGVLNRGAIEKALKRVLKKGGSIIFLDIDHFKKINDTYGHEKGDEVLKEITKIVRNKIRSNDIIGRWGGEEFLIILPGTEYENALKVAEKLRKLIENHDFNGIKVTSSFGVTEIRKGDNVLSVVQRADEMLYNAKNSGRNQVKGIK